jgi:DNA-binding HxlR family transcriptional regulator
MPSTPVPRECSIEAALRVIGEKWSLLIVRELMMGCTKYAEIVRNTGVPRDILTRRLRSLERHGVIYRLMYNAQPPRYDYRLAAAGEQLHGLLVMMRYWGDTYAHVDPEHTVPFRHSCEALLTPELRCEACGEIVQTDSVTWDRNSNRSELSGGVSQRTAAGAVHCEQLPYPGQSREPPRTSASPLPPPASGTSIARSDGGQSNGHQAIQTVVEHEVRGRAYRC